jgi:hypothetical protein
MVANSIRTWYKWIRRNKVSFKEFNAGKDSVVHPYPRGGLHRKLKMPAGYKPKNQQILAACLKNPTFLNDYFNETQDSHLIPFDSRKSKNRARSDLTTHGLIFRPEPKINEEQYFTYEQIYLKVYPHLANGWVAPPWNVLSVFPLPEVIDSVVSWKPPTTTTTIELKGQNRQVIRKCFNIIGFSADKIVQYNKTFYIVLNPDAKVSGILTELICQVSQIFRVQPTEHTYLPYLQLHLPVTNPISSEQYLFMDISTTKNSSTPIPCVETVYLKNCAWILTDEKGTELNSRLWIPSNKVQEHFDFYLEIGHMLANNPQLNIVAYNGAFDCPVLMRQMANPVTRLMTSRWTYDVMRMVKDLKGGYFQSLSNSFREFCPNQPEPKWHESLDDCFGTKEVFFAIKNESKIYENMPEFIRVPEDLTPKPTGQKKPSGPVNPSPSTPSPKKGKSKKTLDSAPKSDTTSEDSIE